MSPKKPWKKILYEAQGYPDNYTDKSFLWELKKNVELEQVSLKEAIFGASKVTEELCTVTLFLLIYVFLYNEWCDNYSIFYTMNCLTIVGFLVYRLSDSKELRYKLGNDIRTLLIFIVFGQLFAPVLHTLTDTISTDSIYTMTVLMLCIHLIFFDYGAPVALVSNSLSLSAAVFAAICLASRLASPHEAFMLITIAIEMFVLFPLLRSKIKRSFAISVGLTCINVVVLINVSLLMTIAFISVIIFINFVCPKLYIRYQYFKDNIYGPWDEAIVEDADNINDLLIKKTI